MSLSALEAQALPTTCMRAAREVANHPGATLHPLHLSTCCFGNKSRIDPLAFLDIAKAFLPIESHAFDRIKVSRPCVTMMRCNCENYEQRK
ncbi:hypothetical protein TcWFU_009711 [Taenia crassiceps]|uniref:Uncharacterized protein n=1 Tax=Taenia crassiceps TaxID=6207 RepID=A0ABR4QBQ1_9CEST